MAPRIARSSLPSAAPKAAKSKSRKRTQDAYAIAGHATASTAKSRSTRLGVVEDDGPKPKRRRDEEEDEEDEDEDERSGGKSRKRARNGDDEVEHGSDSEGNEWVAGGLADGDSDSDLDSDEAFGESDEEKFAGFSFRGGSGAAKPKAKKKVAGARDDGGFDLGEADESEEEESDFGDEGVDLATMLDDNVDEALGSKDMTERDLDGESASDGSDEASDMDEEDDFSELAADDADTEEDEDERHARLQDFVESLDKKAPADKARIVGDEDGGLTVEDLLEDADLDKATLATFKPKRKSKAPQTLAAPLPKRQQDKIDREIATEKAKQQLDRWRDTVMQNRRAEFLQFPLKNADEAEPIGKNVFVPSQFEQPRTELEQNIQKIMEESGMVSKGAETQAAEDAEQGILKAEELATNKLPIEEVLARRAHLRRARELLFREEVKAKRIAKIKSRSYRRVHRKERERQAQKVRLDENGEEVAMDEDEKDVADRKRAAARMGTKHRDSKWAKSLKATDRAVWDESAKEGAVAQARRQEDLRKRVVGKDLSDEAESDMSDDESDDQDGDGITFRSIDKLAKANSTAHEKGIGAMKFMRAADERRKAANDEAIAQIKRDLNGDQSEQDEDDNIGRAIFGPADTAAKQASPKTVRPELEEGERSDDEARQDGDEETNTETTTQKKPRGILKKPTVEHSVVNKGVKDRRQRNDVKRPASDETSAWLEKPEVEDSAWLGRPKGKSSGAKIEEPMVMNAFTTAAIEEAPISLATRPTTAAATSSTNNGADEINSDSDAEQPEAMLSASALKKSQLHRAFAGDDVAAAFAAEKAALTQAEDVHEVSTALPGWGAWTGAALSKHNRRTAAKQRHNPLYKTKLPGGVAAELRKDKFKDNVILSEKTERKGKVYLAPILPHEFERKEEYERSLRLPIGAEWGTKEVVQRNVRPRVVVAKGRVVEAMERPRV
ncbi:hypothetical protein B0A48_01671 [Cryoendolithus antarcticus]|uniref:Uncharacterized protein n=1 Tax=Cryoendolithus antarcticus TaxID=1507870 RepID=A0A1V8TPX7_9PEZI|nr:hypothetical protein B0A48_01671 [Cryoendolithus antarcticus]